MTTGFDRFQRSNRDYLPFKIYILYMIYNTINREFLKKSRFFKLLNNMNIFLRFDRCVANIIFQIMF